MSFCNRRLLIVSRYFPSAAYSCRVASFFPSLLCSFTPFQVLASVSAYSLFIALLSVAEAAKYAVCPPLAILCHNGRSAVPALFSFAVFHLTTYYLTSSSTNYVHSLFCLFPCRSPLINKIEKKKWGIRYIKSGGASHLGCCFVYSLIHWSFSDVRSFCAVDVLLSHSFRCDEGSSFQRRLSVSSGIDALSASQHLNTSSILFVFCVCMLFAHISFFTSFSSYVIPLLQPYSISLAGLVPRFCCDCGCCWNGGLMLKKNDEEKRRGYEKKHHPFLGLQTLFVCCFLWCNRLSSMSL